jgi:hypothetical protein
MTAKEYKQGDVIMEVGDPNNHVLWILSGTVRIGLADIPSFQASRGHIIGANALFRTAAEGPRCVADTFCAVGMLNHVDIEVLSVHMPALLRVLGAHASSLYERVIAYKDAQIDDGKERERDKTAPVAAADDSEKRKREKDKIVRNIQEIASLGRQRESDKITKHQYDDVVNKYAAAHFASNEAMRANSLLRQDLDATKQARDKAQADLARLGAEKRQLEHVLLGVRAELREETHRREVTETDRDSERRRREGAEERLRWSGREHELQMGEREQTLLADRLQWQQGYVRGRSGRHTTRDFLSFYLFFPQLRDAAEAAPQQVLGALGARAGARGRPRRRAGQRRRVGAARRDGQVRPCCRACVRLFAPLPALTPPLPSPTGKPARGRRATGRYIASASTPPTRSSPRSWRLRVGTSSARRGTWRPPRAACASSRRRPST